MFTYHDNAQDRLVGVEDVNGGTIAEYAYDPFGRRLWKEVGGTRTSFFYADEGLVAEYDATGTKTTSYGYKPDPTWTTDPLWLRQGDECYFYQNDHLGTPQKLVKQNGSVVWSAGYTVFGQARVEVETVTNNLRFPGQYFDAETGLHYNWHRYYTPGAGRYLRKDPIGFTGGINTFSYGNNPLIFMDPWGLSCCTSWSECFNKCFGILNPDPFKTIAKILHGIVDHVGDWNGGLGGTADDLEQLSPYGAGLEGWIVIRTTIDKKIGNG